MLDVGRALHVGQQTGVPSRSGRQIGGSWVVSIGDGCAQNRSMRLDTSSVEVSMLWREWYQGTRKPWWTACGLNICICPAMA